MGIGCDSLWALIAHARCPKWTAENRPRYNRDRLRYPSDLTDEEWALIAPLIPPGKPGGSARHWQPVLRMYISRLTTSRRSTVRLRQLAHVDEFGAFVQKRFRRRRIDDGGPVDRCRRLRRLDGQADAKREQHAYDNR